MPTFHAAIYTALKTADCLSIDRAISTTLFAPDDATNRQPVYGAIYSTLVAALDETIDATIHPTYYATINATY